MVKTGPTLDAAGVCAALVRNRGGRKPARHGAAVTGERVVAGRPAPARRPGGAPRD